MTHLKGEGHHVTEIKCQENGGDMQDPPSGLVAHEIFQHVTSRASGRGRKRRLSLRYAPATIPAAETLSFSRNFPFPCVAPFAEE